LQDFKVAEQVEIINVGNNGVASEATLKLLLAAIDKMSRATGKDSKSQQEAVKSLVEETRARITGTKTIKENTQAVEENNEAVEKSTDLLSKFSNSLLTSVSRGLGSIFASAQNLSKELLSSSTDLSAFARHLPIVGERLELSAKYLDESIAALRSLSATGATFNNSLVLLRQSAAESYMSLNDYTNMIRTNTERLAAFGGTVTGGAAATTRLFRELGTTRQELMNMGLTITDINEGLIYYQYISRAGSRVQQRDTQAQAQAAAEYIKQINILSKLTGQDARVMQERIAAQQSDIAFQMQLSRLSAEEQEIVRAGLAEAFALQGEVGAQYFRQQFLGMPPLTEETRIFAATMAEAASQIANLARISTSTGMTLSEFNEGSIDRMGDFIEGAARDAQRLENVLAAAASGLDGPGRTMIDIFRQQNIDLTKYFDEYGRFNRQMLDEDLRTAREEAGRRNNITTALNEFTTTILNARNKILQVFIDSGIFDAAASAVTWFANAIERTVTFIDTALESISQMFGTDKVTAALVIGIGSVFTALAAKMSLSLLFNSLSSRAAGLGSSTAGQGRNAGTGAAGLGRGIGQGTGGILSGIGNSLALLGPKSPMIVAGAAAIGASITLIGAGIAGATWLIGAALPNLAEGLRSFEVVDGENLIQVGLGLTALGVGLVAFGSGQVVGAIGNIVGNILDGLNSFFGGSTIFDKLEEFASYNFDVNRIENNSKAIIDFSLAMAAAGAGSLTSSIGNAARNLRNGIVSLFGGDTQMPWDRINEFGNATINVEGVERNAAAMTAFANAFTGFTEIPSERTGGLFGWIASTFAGDVQMPWDRVNDFADAQINAEGVVANARAMAAFANAFSNFPEISTERTGGVFGWIASTFAGDVQMPWNRVREFGNELINVDGVVANARAMAAFADAFRDLPEIPTERTGGVFGWIASTFAGDVQMPWDRVREFGNATINVNGVVANARAMAAFANAFRDLPEIPTERTSGVFGWIASTFAGDVQMPWDRVNDFADAQINAEGVVANARAMAAFANAFSNIPEISSERTGGVFGWIASTFAGDVQMPWNRVNDFADAQINVEGVERNARAMQAFANAFSNIPEISSERTGGVFGWIASTFAGDVQMPWGRVMEFADAQINVEGVVTNARAMAAFADAFRDLPEISSERTSGVFGWIASTFAGDVQMPWSRVMEFADAQINAEGIERNAAAMSAFANAFSNIPEIPSERTGGVFRWIASTFAGDVQMPWNRVNDFADAQINVEGVENNARAMQAFASSLDSLSGINMSTFDLPQRFTNNLIRLMEAGSTSNSLQGVASGLTQIADIANLREQLTVFDNLNTNNIDSYANSIENLKNELIELNRVLADSNDTWRTERLSAGELLQSVNLTNNINAENIQALNTTLLEILTILTENREIDLQIERHTRRIGSGSDLSRGYISDIR
jgi:hypothetical protein